MATEDIRSYISHHYPDTAFTVLSLSTQIQSVFPDKDRRFIVEKVRKCLEIDEKFRLVRKSDLEAYYVATHRKATMWEKYPTE